LRIHKIASTRLRPRALCFFAFCAMACFSTATGEGWLAAGDAALSLDPLSSQGLFKALYTGLAGGHR